MEIPFPGTPAHRRYLKQGRIVRQTYDDYIGKDRAVHRPAQMSSGELERGIRWLMRRYYSPRHRARVAAAAINNRALFHQWPPLGRLLAMTALSAYETYLWQYRATPSLRWLYERLMPYNPLRYPGDWLRGTNFWGEPRRGEEADVRLTTRSPFAEVEGKMAPGETRLHPA